MIASSATDNIMPAWSPDGQRIAFSSERDSDAEIFVDPASGKGLVRVTRNEVDDLDPTWSRDGRRVAFIRATEDDERRAVVADADGRNAHRLLQADILSHPEWSPDGRWIALRLDSNIAAVPSSGGHPRLVAWAGSSSYPTWSPDGTQLAFTSFRGDDARLRGLHRAVQERPDATGDQQRLQRESLDSSPDGRLIAFARAISTTSLLDPRHPARRHGERRLSLLTSVDHPSWPPLP